MNSIQVLDAELCKLQQAFSRVAADAEFNYVCSLSNEALIKQQAYKGIYLIEIRTTGPHKDLASWFTAFQADWEHPKFKSSFTPNTKKKRIAAHRTLSEWMPLYIGKAKIVSSRVWEHVDLELQAKTFALKLRQRPTLKLRDFRLSTINLTALDVQNYDLVAPAVEQAMRNKLNPLVGRQ